MRRPTARAHALALAVLAFSPALARAQAVLGPGDDALVLPRGVFRVRVVDQRATFDQRYGKDTPGYANGALEPLAVDFNLDTIGLAQFPNLARVQAGFASLSGIPSYRLSLGATRVSSVGTVTAVPLVLEGGITKKLSVGVTIPLVWTRNDIQFDVNPLGREGNVGFNPAFASSAAATQNATLVSQILNSAQLVVNSRGGETFCANNPGDAGCAVASQARQFAGGIAQLYGTTQGAGSPFVPIAGTEVQASVEARLAGLKAAMGPAGAGITIAGPFAAQNRLTVSDAQRILSDPAFGTNAEPLQTTYRSSIGDIELGAKYLLFDSFHGDPEARYHGKGFNFRTAVTGVYRFGTGTVEGAENFVDIGTGGGENGVQARLSQDIVYGTRLWTSFTFRAGTNFGDRVDARVVDTPNQHLLPYWRRENVERKLGNYWDFEADPRVALTDFFQVGGYYLRRHKAADTYKGRFEIDSAVTGYAGTGTNGAVVIDAKNLELETEQSETRLGFGFTLSSLARFQAGKSKLPLEVTYLHFQTVNGEGGNVPKAFVDQVQLRLYTRLFGK